MHVEMLLQLFRAHKATVTLITRPVLLLLPEHWGNNKQVRTTNNHDNEVWTLSIMCGDSPFLSSSVTLWIFWLTNSAYEAAYHTCRRKYQQKHKDILHLLGLIHSPPAPQIDIWLFSYQMFDFWVKRGDFLHLFDDKWATVYTTQRIRLTLSSCLGWMFLMVV